MFFSADAARRLLREKRRLRIQERQLPPLHVERLHRQVVKSLQTRSLHLELIDDMKRLDSRFCTSAHARLGSYATGTLLAEEGGES